MLSDSVVVKKFRTFGLEGISMIDHHSLAADPFVRNPFSSAAAAERALNAAILQADISSFEEYLEIFDAFYSDEIEASSDTGEGSIRGKARVRSILLDFLIPLHVLAEVGGLSISLRETPIPGDAVGEAHSAWTLELAGVSGKTCTLSWRTFRKWDGAYVVYEHHYDQQQSGEPLTSDDLYFNAAGSEGGWCQEPS